MARDKPQVSVWGLLALGKYRKNSVRILLENMKISFVGRKNLRRRKKEVVTKEERSRRGRRRSCNRSR